MSTLSDLWKGYIEKNPSAANNPVPFQTPMKAPVIANPVKVNAPSKPIFQAPPVDPNAGKVQLPANYINPTTGQLYTPEEFANNVASKIPVKEPKGDVPTYAGNVLTQAPQTESQLNQTRAGLVNSRNDIAVGATDPYKVGNNSGVAYSPEELAAIEKAYAGIYDPAINSALTKLDEKQKADAKIAADADWEKKQKFATDENIRQYNATTAINKKSDADLFTQSQLNSGATNANIPIKDFELLDPDLKNFFINNTDYKSAMKDLAAGKITAQELAKEIADGNAPASVKEYFLKQLPLTPVEQTHWYNVIWNVVSNIAK